MIRRLILILVAAGVLGLSTRWILKSYSVDLVHIVVLNAISQKAPEDYPRSRIHQVFDGCLNQVRQNRGTERYLKKLLKTAHGLEKVQWLERNEVDALLKDLKCD